jgi:putative ATPase
MLVIASEDIGLADPQALVQVKTAIDSFKQVGLPEGLIIMAQAVHYLALAPKSNSSYLALHEVQSYVRANKEIFPPKNILNATTKLQQQQGYKKGYLYDHDFPHGFSGQNFFPEYKSRQQFYQPKNIGFERDLVKRIDFFNKIRKSKSC